jgi:hypothetical protein
VHSDIATCNKSQTTNCREICHLLAREIQWDYKNIVKRKGKLVRLR